MCDSKSSVCFHRAVHCVSLPHFLLIDLHRIAQEADCNLHVCVTTTNSEPDLLDHSAAAGAESAF